MDLNINTKTVCTQCRKDKVHVDICKAKDKSMREQVEVEFAVCGVCGRGYCSLRANTDDRICEFCSNDIYNNVNEDGTLERQLTWSEKK